MPMKIKSVTPTLPVEDLSRARRFYEDKLGLKVESEDPSPGVTLKAGDCSLYLYQRSVSTKGDHTQAYFMVDDVEKTMTELRDKGVVFEDYNLPNLKTEHGLFRMENMKAAWFKDTEGNTLSIMSS